MWVFWLITICCTLLFAAIVWKTQKKDDKVFHLLWLTPIIGGYLCTLSFFILATNSPHTRDFAEIKAIYGSRFEAGPTYFWAVIGWCSLTAIGIVVQFIIRCLLTRKQAERERKQQFAKDFIASNTDQLEVLVVKNQVEETD